ncbi:hypothetical protein KSS87_008499 [Heliosperma pusillum]|nr:hypothetical protein KSS87_008499 [Heliosperma pusillum]
MSQNLPARPSDRAALLSIKASLNEPYLGIFKSWSGPDCCHDWYRVTCDDARRVAEINLRGESEDPIFERAHRTGFMTGSLSPDICKLDRLSTLTIADWKGISGVIPECITSLILLHHLDLVGNQMTGKIPSLIGQLKELTVINLADNALTGSIPPSLVNLARLMHLDLRNNKLSGELPSEMGRLQMLSRALLSGNQLGGPFPASIANIYRLSDLDISLNRLSGEIPDVFDKMPVLSTLNLDGNMISGQLPKSLLRSSVSILNLSRNGLGQLPDMFGPRSYFTALDLSYNRLSGEIPKSISSAAYIGHLDLSHNHLCGPIPNGAPFDHLEATSFAFNNCLCGKPLGSRC